MSGPDGAPTAREEATAGATETAAPGAATPAADPAEDAPAASSAIAVLPAHGHRQGHARGRLSALALGALGVVYGDIGTSPLYALRECFHASYGIAPTRENVLGILSLFAWSLILVVVLKYIVFVTRAHNDGEGGILALLALVLQQPAGRAGGLVIAGLFGAALLYADGMLTPAISVVSAVEGIGEIEALRGRLDPYIVPIAIAILVGLFLVQKRGTGGVGMVFGPVMLVWFATIGFLGASAILRNPSVLEALWPGHAIAFFAEHGWLGFLVLGSVVLCITGGEALYADMGHFGRKPIVLAWLFAAFPGLLLNYFGQGALILEDPAAVAAPFFALTSGWLRIPLVLLATLATVIASQALISGAFSITRQAIQLGYLPRLEIRHTSSETEGQIYLPEVNRILMIACIALVLAFQSSSRMAAAYGIAVTGTMAITTVLFFVVARTWWGTALAALACAPMLAIDLAFFSANVVKIESGGWIPLAIGLAILAMMTTWKRGRERVAKALHARSVPLDEFLETMAAEAPTRLPGTAVFMTATAKGTPPVLRHHYRHTHAVHEQVVLLSIVTEDAPVVPRDRRIELEDLGHGFFRLEARYGFMQSPRVTDVLRAAHAKGLETAPESTSFYLGREKLVITKSPGLAGWRKGLFAILSRNARAASDFFRLPPDRVLEIGIQIEI